ncbi:efflux transporter outer membrane subunit [Ampullimonas aquatilis]|uniref:efflux transporter outer membrane subunit n=1 Tax=Ampullimonas aquatilis TaxID=1341549 RepID=UPI003C789EC3
MKTRSRPHSLLPAIGLTLLLAGCASYSGIAPVAQLQTPQQLGASQQDGTDWPAQDWWQQFDDPILTQLIDKALSGNPNLKLAETRISKAGAAAGLAQSSLGLQVSGDLSTERQRFSEHGIYPPPLGGNVYTLNNASLGASWEFDYFGRNQAALNAAIGNVRAAKADAQAARELLASNVARSYFALARLFEQKTIAQASLQQRQAIRELVVSRVKAGLDTNVERRQAEGSVPEIERDIAALDEQISLTRNALAALLGDGPQSTATLSPRLAKPLATNSNTTIPADLLGRRADISAARWRVEAATQGIAEAKAAFYPNINLKAFVGLNSLGFPDWIEAGSREYGAGAALHLPIFDAGRLRAGLRGRTADVDAAIESYNMTLNEAIHDVADQLGSLQSLAIQNQQQQLASQAAEQAYDLAQQRFRAGLSTYLTVLSAQTNVLAQQRNQTDLQARLLDTRIRLIHALGGGFNEAPTAALVGIANSH